LTDAINILILFNTSRRPNQMQKMKQEKCTDKRKEKSRGTLVARKKLLYSVESMNDMSFLHWLYLLSWCGIIS